MTTTLNLSLPPRQVPWTIQVRILFESLVGQVGWVFLTAGMIFTWIVLPHAELTSSFQFRGSLQTAPAVITASEKTSFEDTDPIYQYQYVFNLGELLPERSDSHHYPDVSYAANQPLPVGSKVTVEFPPSNPACSRIQGMRCAPCGPATLIVLIFPLLGAALLVPSLWSGCRKNRFLKAGSISPGDLQSTIPTACEINDR